MKTRKYNGGRKHRKTRRGQKRYGVKHKHKTKYNNRYKRKRPNMKKTRRKRGGAIPMGPIITVGLLGLAAIVGPIAATYMDETNIERTKREADDVMKTKAEALKDERMYFGRDNPNPGEKSGREDAIQNDADFADEEDEKIISEISPEYIKRKEEEKIRNEIGKRARKQSESMIRESPYWDTSTGIAKPIPDDAQLQPSP